MQASLVDICTTIQVLSQEKGFIDGEWEVKTGSEDLGPFAMIWGHPIMHFHHFGAGKAKM
eukprot:1159853-Pelagomonas_calceolata.AAC.5